MGILEKHFMSFCCLEFKNETISKSLVTVQNNSYIIYFKYVINEIINSKGMILDLTFLCNTIAFSYVCFME